MRNLNAITPETETTSHYFWGQAHDWDVANKALTDMLVGQITTAFLEDVAVFEAQQRNMTILPNAPQIDINADAGLIQARRILERIHEEELAAVPPPYPPPRAGEGREGRLRNDTNDHLVVVTVSAHLNGHVLGELQMANEHAAGKVEASDRSVLDHIRELVAEEQRLYQHRAPTDADQERLQKVKIELDQYWDLLRQRRALEEFGRDPADAHLRPAQIVEKYEG